MLQKHDYIKNLNIYIVKNLSQTIKHEVILSGKGEWWKGKYKPFTDLAICLLRQRDPLIDTCIVSHKLLVQTNPSVCA